MCTRYASPFLLYAAMVLLPILNGTLPLSGKLKHDHQIQQADHDDIINTDWPEQACPSKQNQHRHHASPTHEERVQQHR